MAYTMEESRKAFEHVRGLLLAATDETLDVSTIVGDTDFIAIIADEQERIEFVNSLRNKYWMLSEEAKLAGTFTFAGTCAGDGYVNISLGGESFSFAPTTGDDPDAIALQCTSTINSQSVKWTASASGDTTRVLPLVSGLNGSTFSSTSTDTGITVTDKDPNQAPIDIQLGGDARLNGRGSIFGGSAFRS